MHAVITRKAQLRGQPNSLYFEYNVWDSWEAMEAGVQPDQEAHVIQRNWIGKRVVRNADRWMRTTGGVWIDPTEFLLGATETEWEYEASSIDMVPECRSLIERNLLSIATRNVAPKLAGNIQYEDTQLGRLAALEVIAIGEQRPQRPRGMASAVLDLQVGASGDDARQITSDAVSIDSTSYTTDAVTEHIGLRFITTIPAGVIVSIAQMAVSIQFAFTDEPQHQLRGETSAAPAIFTAAPNSIDSRGRTTATHNWDSADLGATAEEFWEWGASLAGAGNGADVGSIIQENVDALGELTNLVCIFEQHTANSGRDLGINFWDGDTTLAAKLHIEHSPAAAPTRRIFITG